MRISNAQAQRNLNKLTALILDDNDMKAAHQLLKSMPPRTSKEVFSALPEEARKKLTGFALKSLVQHLMPSKADVIAALVDHGRAEEALDAYCDLDDEEKADVADELPSHVRTKLIGLHEKRNKPVEPKKAKVQPHVHKDVIYAFANGAAIQSRNPNTGNWVDVPTPRFLAENEYRVKPAEVDLSGVRLPWDYLNPKYNFIAKDEDGIWGAYVEKPTIRNGVLGSYGEGINIDDLVPEDANNQVPKMTVVARPQ